MRDDYNDRPSISADHGAMIAGRDNNNQIDNSTHTTFKNLGDAAGRDIVHNHLVPEARAKALAPLAHHPDSMQCPHCGIQGISRFSRSCIECGDDFEKRRAFEVTQRKEAAQALAMQLFVGAWVGLAIGSWLGLSADHMVASVGLCAGSSPVVCQLVGDWLRRQSAQRH